MDILQENTRAIGLFCIRLLYQYYFRFVIVCIVLSCLVLSCFVLYCIVVVIGKMLRILLQHMSILQVVNSTGKYYRKKLFLIKIFCLDKELLKNDQKFLQQISREGCVDVSSRILNLALHSHFGRPVSSSKWKQTGKKKLFSLKSIAHYISVTHFCLLIITVTFLDSVVLYLFTF